MSRGRGEATSTTRCGGVRTKASCTGGSAPWRKTATSGFRPRRETCKDPRKTLAKIRELGAKASIAVNPDVPLEAIESLLPVIDMLLMMTVFPGFAGQAFISDVLPKIEKARAVINRERYPILIEADGGIKADNIGRVVKAGAEVIVSGSGIFKIPSYADTIRKMRTATTGV